MPLALIASAGTTANEYLARHVAELGYPRPVIVASGGEARRRLGEKDFAVVVINTPLPDEFGPRAGRLRGGKKPRRRAAAGQGRHRRAESPPNCRSNGVLVLSKPFSGAQFRQAVQVAASCSRRLALLLEENARLADKLAQLRLVGPGQVPADRAPRHDRGRRPPPDRKAGHGHPRHPRRGGHGADRGDGGRRIGRQAPPFGNRLCKTGKETPPASALAAMAAADAGVLLCLQCRFLARRYARPFWRAAAWVVFFISMARVMGPTPPGTGVM